MSQLPLWAKPPIKLQMVKTPRPIMKTRRRPKRSAARPPSIRNPAKVSVYAFTTHCWPATESPRLSRIWGSATLTIATSSTTMNWAMQQMTRIALVGSRCSLVCWSTAQLLGVRGNYILRLRYWTLRQ